MADVSLSVPLPADEWARDGRAYHVLKRVLDVLLASLLLALLWPVFLILALAVKIDSPGPVIFRQQRLRGRRVRTRDGVAWQVEPFTLYKFRTMRVDADHSLHQEYMTAYLSRDHDRLEALRPGRRDGESFRPAKDPRVTRVGGTLRKLSLDEFPQLWNVVKGDMSLVGPRPPLPYEVEMYEDYQLKRLTSLPGLTGWAQVKGRSGIGADELFRLDVEYITRRSTVFDLKILLLTLPVVLSMRGAD